MLLHLTDRSPEPLNRQISRQLREKILAGDLTDGTQLPSIRAFARQYRVSVITVQRAYEDLEREELIHARRGKGFFVSSFTERLKQRMAEERLAKILAPVLQEALASGLSEDAVLEIVNRILKKKDNTS